MTCRRDFFRGGINAHRCNSRLRAARTAAGGADATLNFDNALCHRSFLEAGLQRQPRRQIFSGEQPFPKHCRELLQHVERGLQEANGGCTSAAAATKGCAMPSYSNASWRSKFLKAITMESCAESFRKTTTYIPAMVRMQAFQLNIHVVVVALESWNFLYCALCFF